MSFIENLAKGFVRSTVNQVGRDSGKVISNNIYGDAHSTPYRRVDGAASLQLEEEPINERIEKIYREIPKSGVFKKCVYAFLAYMACSFSAMLFTVFPLLCVIPPAIFAYVGYYRSHREEYKVNLVEYVAVPTYVSDRRYKDGRRYAGDILQKRVTKTAAFPEEEEVLIARAKWWYYLAGGILACAVFSGIYLMNHPEMMK